MYITVKNHQNLSMQREAESPKLAVFGRE